MKNFSSIPRFLLILVLRMKAKLPLAETELEVIITLEQVFEAAIEIVLAKEGELQIAVFEGQFSEDIHQKSLRDQIVARLSVGIGRLV